MRLLLAAGADIDTLAIGPAYCSRDFHFFGSQPECLEQMLRVRTTLSSVSAALCTCSAVPARAGFVSAGAPTGAGSVCCPGLICACHQDEGVLLTALTFANMEAGSARHQTLVLRAAVHRCLMTALCCPHSTITGMLGVRGALGLKVD